MCYRADRDVVEKAVGDTSYGKFILDEMREMDEYQLSHPGVKIDYNDIDRLQELIGVLSVYVKVLKGASQEALDTPNEIKIQICKEALKAIKDLETTEKKDEIINIE